MKKFMKLGAVSALSLMVGASAAFAENIKIAFIDPLSGPFASTGTNGSHQFEFAADYMVNQKGGVLGGTEFEVMSFLAHASPKEAATYTKMAQRGDLSDAGLSRTKGAQELSNLRKELDNIPNNELKGDDNHG